MPTLISWWNLTLMTIIFFLIKTHSPYVPCSHTRNARSPAPGPSSPAATSWASATTCRKKFIHEKVLGHSHTIKKQKNFHRIHSFWACVCVRRGEITIHKNFVYPRSITYARPRKPWWLWAREKRVGENFMIWAWWQKWDIIEKLLGWSCMMVGSWKNASKSMPKFAQIGQKLAKS